MEGTIPADRWREITEGRTHEDVVAQDLVPQNVVPGAPNVHDSPSLIDGETGVDPIKTTSLSTHDAVRGVLRGVGDVGHNIVLGAGNALGSGVSQLLLGKGPDNDLDSPDLKRAA